MRQRNAYVIPCRLHSRRCRNRRQLSKRRLFSRSCLKNRQGAPATAGAASRVLLLREASLDRSDDGAKACQGCVVCDELDARHVEVGWPPGVLIAGVMRDSNEAVASACGERPPAGNAASQTRTCESWRSPPPRRRRRLEPRRPEQLVRVLAVAMRPFPNQDTALLPVAVEGSGADEVLEGWAAPAGVHRSAGRVARCNRGCTSRRGRTRPTDRASGWTGGGASSGRQALLSSRQIRGDGCRLFSTISRRSGRTSSRSSDNPYGVDSALVVRSNGPS